MTSGCFQDDFRTTSGYLQDNFRMTQRRKALRTQREREQSDFVIPSESKILRLVYSALIFTSGGRGVTQ